MASPTESKVPEGLSDICFTRSIGIPTLEISHPMMRKLLSDYISSDNNHTFVQLLNIELKCVQLVQPNVNIEAKCLKNAYKIRRKYTESHGRAKQECNKKVYKMVINDTDFVNVQGLIGQFINLRSENEKLANVVNKSSNQYIYNKESESQIKELKATIECLHNQLQAVESSNDSVRDLLQRLKCTVGKRQMIRRVKMLKSRISQALWFSSAMGLRLESVNFTIEGTNNFQSFDYSEQGETSLKSDFSNLKEGDQEKLKTVLGIMDQFNVGDAAYHEISYLSSDLPKSYLLKQCRSQINAEFKIFCTPGMEEGVQVSFQEELISQVKKRIFPLGPIRVKIGGDGAQMSKVSSYLTLSFSFLDCDSDIVFPISIVKASEKYCTMQRCLREVLEEINRVEGAGHIVIEGQEYPIELYIEL